MVHVLLLLVPEEGKGELPGETSAQGTSDGSGESSEVKPSGANGEGSEVKPAGASGEGSEVKPEEEETDLQLAWEILELARIICQRSEVMPIVPVLIMLL